MRPNCDQAADQHRRDLMNRIARDVRTAWFDVNRTYRRLDVTKQLLAQAHMAQDLAQTRYNLGLGTIVEYSQAELEETRRISPTPPRSMSIGMRSSACGSRWKITEGDSV